jgi:ferredoxin
MERTTIYYFSGTGNSLAAARSLAAALPGSSIVPMAACLASGRIPETVQRIGFVFPMYFYGCPSIVLDFVDRFDFSQAIRRFALVTFAGPFTGSLVALRDALKKRGSKLDEGYYQAFPNNYPLSGYDVAPEAKRDAILENARTRIEAIARKITLGSGGIARTPFDLVQGPISRSFLKRVHGEGANFSAAESCSGCGACAAACPAGNIAMEAGKPNWKTACELCLACYSYCPSGSVRHANIKPGKGRYRNPSVAAADIGAQKTPF